MNINVSISEYPLAHAVSVFPTLPSHCVGGEQLYSEVCLTKILSFSEIGIVHLIHIQSLPSLLPLEIYLTPINFPSKV